MIYSVDLQCRLDGNSHAGDWSYPDPSYLPLPSPSLIDGPDLGTVAQTEGGGETCTAVGVDGALYVARLIAT
jgi:hypothetical protein